MSKINFNTLKEKLTFYSNNEIQLIEKAYNFSYENHGKQLRVSGEPFICHPVQVAKNLIEMRMDVETISAGLLHDVIEDTDIDRVQISKIFGDTIAELVDGVTKFTDIQLGSTKLQKSESIRKMLLAMVKDVRVILIKFADRLHNMRTLSYLSEVKQKRIALETMDIYTPLASRLGMNRIKNELEDLAFQYLHKLEFKEIRQYLDKHKIVREDMLEKAIRELSVNISRTNMEFEIKARIKNLYSIFQKKLAFGLSLEEIYDYLGVRIITRNISDCYHILGIIHNIWNPIDSRFKDYIAKPKANLYQSLHTTVIFHNKPLEVQIRTKDMDEIAEFGVAAHWHYKAESNKKPVELKWMKKLKALHVEENDPVRFYEAIKNDILKEEIYVFTPRGDVIELIQGATPIDFAYHIHTDVGHTCIGAKVNGQIVNLKTALKNGQTVEIMTNKNSHPKKGWLNIVKSTRTKQKIRYWFSRQEAEQKEEDKEKEQELKEKKQTEEHQIKKAVKTEYPVEITAKNVFDKSRIQMVVNGHTNIMIKHARCCHPLPGDKIIGFISRGRGVIIHKEKCRNLKHLVNLNNNTNNPGNRLIEVNWLLSTKKEIMSFSFRAKKEGSIFAEIKSVAIKFDAHLVQGSITHENRKKHIINGLLSLEISDKSNVKHMIKNIGQIPSMIDFHGI